MDLRFAASGNNLIQILKIYLQTQNGVVLN